MTMLLLALSFIGITLPDLGSSRAALEKAGFQKPGEDRIPTRRDSHLELYTTRIVSKRAGRVIVGAQPAEEVRFYVVHCAVMGVCETQLGQDMQAQKCSPSSSGQWLCGAGPKALRVTLCERTRQAFILEPAETTRGPELCNALL
jgi:hypothetical protein